jgi:iron complex outermembrane recepter protein
VKTRIPKGSAAYPALLALAQATVHAQAVAPSETYPPGNAIEDVVVTATKLGTTELQKTASAITVFSADQLEASLVNNVKDLVSFTPNLNVGQATASAQIYIRGIGSNNVFNGSDPDVTVQADGVYIARAFGQFADFVDVERIEVLRGPQGTLYGRNAVGGVINVISRKPSEDFEAKVQLTGGSDALAQGQAYVSGPLVSNVLQGSLSANYISRDGYVDNVVAGAPDVGDADRWGARGQLRFAPNDRLEAITRVDWNEADERFDSYSHLLAPTSFAPLANSTIGDFGKAALDTPQDMRTQLRGVSEDIKIDFSDALTLQSITAYRRSDYVLNVDVDSTEFPVILGYQTDHSKQFSQELNLGLHLQRLEAVVGAYYFNEHETSTIRNTSAPSVATPFSNATITTVMPDSHVRSAALYTQGTYHLTDALGLTLGVRYTEDRKEIDQDIQRIPFDPTRPSIVFMAGPPAKTYESWTPKIAIEYQAAPDLFLFTSATKGFKSGGTNFAATNLLALTFDPEQLWSYEAGLKSDWLDHRVRVNATGFYYDYEDLQVQSLIAPGVVSIGNAASATVRGLELETILRPLEGLTLTLNYALLDSEYDSFPNAAVPSQLRPYVSGSPDYDAATNTFDATGNRLTAAPDSSVSASIQYDYPLARGSLFLRGEYYWQGRAYYDPSNTPIMSQEPYDLINVSAGYQNVRSGWSARIIAKNIVDTQYLITVAANGVVPAGLAGAPRTIALQLTKSW